MAIKVINEIEDNGKSKEVVFELHLPSHFKHSNHLECEQSDIFEWGIGGKCDEDDHKISCKVNMPEKSDKHLEINAKSGDTVVVRFSNGDYTLKVYSPE